MNYLTHLPKSVWALAGSVILGIVFTFIWAELLYYAVHRKFRPEKRDRVRWVSVMNGILQRGFLTTIVIWLPMAAGPIAATLIALTAIAGWGHYDNKSVEGRTRYAISLMISVTSIFWAIAWGIWAMPQSK